MPDVFTLKIDMGNAAMQQPDDVARALRRVAVALADGATAGRIRDDNGNTVGEWSLDD